MKISLALQPIVQFHNLSRRGAICDFDERPARLAYDASDFVMMPSRLEPCGLPIGHDTGGVHDTITRMDVANNTDDGLFFKDFDSNGLSSAIDEAIEFCNLNPKIKKPDQA